MLGLVSRTERRGKYSHGTALLGGETAWRNFLEGEAGLRSTKVGFWSILQNVY